MTRDSVLVDLALQGGGAHGAFTWGVLDRLLEEPWLRIDGISGTSAGAMNAAVLADGHAAGGAEGARAALEGFWRSVSRAALLSPLRRTPLDVLLGRWTLDNSPVFVAMDLASRLFSPYDLNPGGFNPLREILAETIDFERLARAPIKVFVTATNVRTGRGHVFRNARDHAGRAARLGLPADPVPGHRDRRRALLGRRLFRQPDHHAAGARMHLAGHHPRPDQPGRAPGHAAHRARHPQPAERGVVQRRAAEGAAHDRAAAPGRQPRRLRRRAYGPHAHSPHRQRAMVELGYSSKLNAEWDFLCMLRDEGRRSAEAFLAAHGEDLGAGFPLDLDLLLEGV